MLNQVFKLQEGMLWSVKIKSPCQNHTGKEKIHSSYSENNFRIYTVLTGS